jgi:nucleoside-diphosphate-sugar epimerase
VLGASGYIGSNLVRVGSESGVDVSPVQKVWVSPIAGGGRGDARGVARRWRRANEEAFRRQVSALEGFEVVVNAVGTADPRAADSDELFAANAVQPAVLAHAAQLAGVRRLVHVSTAAVQGRRDPLDETAVHQPLSPYGRSKAAGERALLDAADHGTEAPPEVVVYRPTSVYGDGRPATRSLARLAARLPLMPVAGGPDRPVPVALADNVMLGIVFTATSPDALGIVLQPWEGITARNLLELFGARRTVPVPPSLVDVALAPLAATAGAVPKLVSRLRWLELVLQGQGVRAEKLLAAGFEPPCGLDAWRALVEHEHESLRMAELSRNGTRPRRR